MKKDELLDLLEVSNCIIESETWDMLEKELSNTTFTNNELQSMSKSLLQNIARIAHICSWYCLNKIELVTELLKLQ